MRADIASLAPSAAPRQVLRGHPRRLIGAVVVIALIAAGCTADEDEPAPEAGVEEPTAQPISTGGAIGALQDLWFISRMQAVADDGTVTDVILDVVEELEGLAGPAVDLIPELAFREVPGLAPVMLNAMGTPRDRIEVVAGLFEVTAVGRAAGQMPDDMPGVSLGIIASAPPDAAHVAPGDLLTLQIFDLDVLADVDMLLIDFAFGQSFAPTAEQTESDTVDAVALLGERWRDGRVAIGAPAEGRVNEAALFVGIPLQRIDSVTARQVTWEPAGTPTVERASLATDANGGVFGREADGPTIQPVFGGDGGGGGGGFFPPKSHGPLAETAVSTLICVAFGAAALPPGAVIVAVICTGVGVLGAAYTVSKLLEDNMKPPPRPPTCRRPCARSSGDPHLGTFTGEGFGLQAAGEFTAASTADGAIDVQVRMIPFNDRVAINGAIAVQVGESRISLEHERAEPLFLDGVPAQLGEYDAVDLDGGGSLERNGSSVIIEWPDGSYLWVDMHRRGLDYRLQLEPEAASSVEGLHGSGDGQLIAADGTIRSSDDGHDEMLAHADTWRITDEQSLFDRLPGESTATWTDLDFPAATVTVDTLDPVARAFATTICTAAGLVGFHLDSCIIDVALTGDAGYVLSAWDMQAVFEPEGWSGRTVDYLARLADGSTAGQGDDGDLAVRGLAWTRDELLPLNRASGHQFLVVDGIVLMQRAVEGQILERDLVAVALADGSTAWEVERVSACVPVVTADGTVVIVFDDGVIQSREVGTGELLAELEDVPVGIGGCGSGLVATASGLVVRPMMGFGTAFDASGMRAYDTTGGLSLAWSRSFDEDHIATVVSAGGRLYVPQDRGDAITVHRLEEATGATTASIDLDGSVASGPSTLAEGIVIALPDDRIGVLPRASGVASERRLAVLSDDGVQLQLAWDTDPGAILRNDRGFTRVRTVGGLVVGWVGDQLVALNLDDGSEAWTHRPVSFDNSDNAIAVDPAVGVVVAPFNRTFLEVVALDGSPRYVLDGPDSLGSVSHLGPIVDGRILVFATVSQELAAGGTVLFAIDLE